VRKAVAHGPGIAAVILISTIVLYFWINPKDIKLEKIKIENKGEKNVKKKS